MITDTRTTFSSRIVKRDVVLTLRHDLSFYHTFNLKAGCIDEWMTEDEVRALRRVLDAGLRKLKALSK